MSVFAHELGQAILRSRLSRPVPVKGSPETLTVIPVVVHLPPTIKTSLDDTAPIERFEIQEIVTEDGARSCRLVLFVKE